MIPDFPHNIKIRLAWLNFFLFPPDVALSLPCCWDSQKGRDRATSGRNKQNSIGPILFLYYKESLLSSNLNSKLLRFHCAHPNMHPYQQSFFFISKLWSCNIFFWNACFDKTQESVMPRPKLFIPNVHSEEKKGPFCV